MSVSNQDLEHAILTWISTFQDLTHKTDNFESLADGVTLTEIMSRIEHDVFDVSKINPEISDNWALRLNNLSYLYEGLEQYYTNILNKPFDKTHVDIVKVSKLDDRDNLYKLVQLILGAAVQCPKKDVYINEILALDELCQNALMDLIEKILQKCNPEQGNENDTSASFENTFGRTSNLSSNVATKADISDKKLLGKLEELENENQNMVLKFNDLNNEKDQLKVRVRDLLAELEKKDEEIRLLVREREGIQEKLNTQESIEELKNELKLKDLKYEQLEKFIEELKSRHEDEVSRFEAEVEKQKRRVADLMKVEATIEFYKQKCEDYALMTERINEMTEECEKYRKKIEELNKSNEATLSKMNTYKEKLETEKTNNISLDIELTKKKTEIETLKSEKKRLESSNIEFEKKILDLNKTIEKNNREREERANFVGNNEKVMQLASQGLSSFDNDQSTGQESRTAAINEGEKEILEQENNILKTKCKEIQIENEDLKNKTLENTQAIETLNSENNKLKEEIEKLRKGGNSQDAASMKEIVDQKTLLINQLNEEIVTLKSSSQGSKKFEDELKRKDNEVKDLTQELETLRHIVSDVEDQKDKELKILVAAIYELAQTKLDLERQLASRDGYNPLSRGTNSLTVPQVEESK